MEQSSEWNAKNNQKVGFPHNEQRDKFVGQIALPKFTPNM